MPFSLSDFSNQAADTVEAASRSVAALEARRWRSSSAILWQPGVLVSASHSIERVEDIAVTLPGGEHVRATLAGRDSGTDLAVLKFGDTGDEPAVPRASTPPRPGELTLVVGRTPDSGVIAGIGIIATAGGPWRTWRGGRLDQTLRLDFPLTPSLSGSLAVNALGQAVGLATAGLSRVNGMIVPFETIDRVVRTLLARGHMPRGYLGLGLQPVALPAAERERLGRQEAAAMIVLQVEPDSPASKAGFLLGDILLELGGKIVSETSHVFGQMEPESVGKSLMARVLRGGQVMEFALLVAESPRQGERG